MRVRFANFVFDSERRELARDGAAVALSPKAFALLEALIEAAPSPVSKETLYEKLWPQTFVEAGNLHNLVSEIRSVTDRSLIRTVHRFGYAFIGNAAAEEPVRYAILAGDEQIPLRSGANVIGRDPANAVVIPASDVSRYHARIVVSGAQVTLEDLGSKNGTFLGKTRVERPVALKDGDEIFIGTRRLQLRAMRTLPSTLTVSGNRG